jgi:glycosyltransferase involved in cell wall biosynthesis
MRICIVGPGLMPIPPVGWGAVEIIIWDYKQTLEKLGHEVILVNIRNFSEMIRQCNECHPDFVHVQYDEYWPICDLLQCDNVAITSYYAYADQVEKHDYYYTHIANGFASLKKTRIFAVSQKIGNMYLEKGFDSNRLEVIPSGVRCDLFRFNEKCKYENRSIYLAKIETRKRQYLFHGIENLYFAGNLTDSKYNRNNYLGEWQKNYLYDNLTDYANLVLLSDGEAHPLVCMEAMSAGLGIVISEYCTANLDLSLPFIDVVPEDKIMDESYVSEIIEKNRKKSIQMKNEIREYAVNNFSYDNIIRNYYLPAIKKIN